MRLTARVDKEMCMSAGLCIADHPTAFRFDEDEIAETTPEAGLLPPEALRHAAQRCPAEAIVLTDDDGNPVDPFSDLG